MLNVAAVDRGRSMRSEAIQVELAKDDPRQFADLYDTHFERIYRYFYRRVGNRVTAEELTSEVFAKALKALPRYRQSGRPFAAWLYRIASNAMSDHGRQLCQHPTTDELDRVPDPGSVEDLVIHRDEVERIWRLVDSLPADQRTAMRLKFLNDMSIQQIAAVMDRTPGAVKLLIHRGLVRLRLQVHVVHG